MDNINLDWFSFWSSIVPSKTAVTILETEVSYSYKEINDKGEKIAAILANKYNLKKGDRIAILSKNRIEYIYLFAAAQKLGVILVPLNYRLTSYELNNLLEDSDPKILFYSEEFKISTQQCISENIELLNESYNLSDYPKSFISENEPVFILYTSGSTGIPKGVIYTHRMLYWNSLNTSVSLGINSESVALVCMPPFHTGGWNVLLTPLLHHGGHVIITEKFDASKILIGLNKYECNQFMAVPTMLKMIAEDQNFDALKIDQLPYIIVGGEAMSLELINIYEEKGIAVRQGFGMTEAGPNLTSLHHSQSKLKIGSIGKPNMYIQVKLVDEKRNEVGLNELGELCFSGPVVMPGYWNKEEATKKTLIDGWLFSGDIAMKDEDGFIYIKDRKKNMFISGGENVYPAEIERVLLEHNSINEAVVIGVNHDKWGEVGKAFIVLNKKLTIEEIKTYCKTKLSKFKIPKEFVFIDELPINSSGKINRKLLINR